MKAFSWFSDMFKSRKDEDQDSGPVMEVGNVPNWEPVMEIPDIREDDYERTVPVFDIPEWDPNVPEFAPPAPHEPLMRWPEPEDPDPEEIRMAVVPAAYQPQPEAPADAYERTVAAFEIPEWDPDVPAVPEEVPTSAAPVAHWPEPEDAVMEIPAQIPAALVEDYERTSAVYETPKWEPEEIPTSAVPIVHWPEPEDPDPEEIRMAAVPAAYQPQPEALADAYERTVPSFVSPEWETHQQNENAVVEIPAQIPAATAEDYERTVPVFEVPEWEQEPLRTEPVAAVPEVLAAPDPEKTVFSGAVRQMAPAVLPEEEMTRPVAAEEPDQKPAEPEEPWPITGKDTLYPPDYVEAEEKPVPREPEVVIPPVQKAEPAKAAPPAAVKQPEPVKAAPPVESKRPEPPASAPRKATSIPVKPKPATPTVVDMKTPEVPDFGRSISSEICDFSVRQQWNWLGRLHDVIPTLRMGTEPACVDYPLTLRNMQAAGDMRITVRRVAMGVGTILSITNLENAITCEDITKLREASQILTAYGKMVSGRQADAIRMTVRYLGVRVAELQMR